MEFWDGSGISWTIYKHFAPRSRQIATPTPHHSIFTGQTLFMSQEEHLAHNPDAQPTVSKHWRHERIYTKTNLTAICLTVHLHDMTTKHMATSVKLSTAKSMHLQPPNELYADFNLYNIWLIYKNHTPESKKHHR